ncbi:MAG: alpha/beta family hydrolase [Actinomycetes bacterium]
MSDTPVLHHVETPRGPARVHLQVRRGGLVVLGHGAGGGVQAPDLVAAADAARTAGLGVALVEQPWRVAGRRVAEAPTRLDEAWRAVLAALRSGSSGVLVVGGRSAGARVACRTAADTGADAVLALAFPLVAPSGRSRDAELRAPAVPRLVVQGERDAFGVPAPSPGVQVHVVARADHAFAVRRRDGRTAADVAAEVHAAVGTWLAGLRR